MFILMKNIFVFIYFYQNQKGTALITLMKDPYILIAAGQASKHK